MEVVTVSHREKTFRIERSRLAMSNDVLGSWCFGSRAHIPIKNCTNINTLRDYDLVWFTMFKLAPYDKAWMNLLCEFKSEWPQKKVILFQDAEVEGYLMCPRTKWDLQKGWIEVLQNKVDLVLAHNDRDAKLYRYFVEKGEVETWTTLQSIEQVTEHIKDPSEKEKMVGVSTYDGRSNGIVGVSVASKVTKNITQINRVIYDDDRQEVVNKRFRVTPKFNPICVWKKYIAKLSELYVYLHPMPVSAAGRDAITCAVLGVPIIGNEQIDTQAHLFPELSVDCYDVEKMERLLLLLLNDNGFYAETIKYAMDRVGLYSVESGLERANKIMQRLGWK